MSDRKQKVGSIFLIVLMIASSFTVMLFIQDTAKATGENWWDAGYGYRKLMTINASQVSGTHINFPILVYRTSDEDIGINAQADGDDFVFINYDDNSTKYNHEIENFNSSTGTLTAWVNITTLTGTTKLWMYYGNASASNQQNVIGTWNSNYVLVQHFNGSTNVTLLDSTAYNNDVVNSSGTPLYGQAAPIGHYVGVGTGGHPTSAVISKSDSLNVTNNITTEYYVKFASINMTATQEQYIWAKYSGQSGYSASGKNLTANGRFSITHNSGSASMESANSSNYVLPNSFEKDSWYFVTGKTNATTNRSIYINGTFAGAFNVDVGLGTANASLTLFAPGTYEKAYYFNGTLDELRISNIDRGEAYITTNANTQQNPTTFILYGNEEEPEGEPEPDEDIGYDMTPGSEVSEWNVSENVIGGTLEEDWAYLGGTWDTRLAPSWAGNYTLRATFNQTESIVAALCNLSVMNRSQSLAWARVNVSLQNYSYVFPGIVYAIRNSSSFSFVCFGDMEVFLLDYIDGSIYNTLDLSLVEYYQDATNYMDLWGFSQKPQEETVYHFEPYNASGLWMKTIYNGYPGILNAKDWGLEHEQQVLYNLMDEPLGWAFNGSTNNSANESYGFGVCAWRPADIHGDLNQVEFDCMQSWRLNSSVNDQASCWDGEMRGYKPHMNFSIIDTMAWSGDAAEIFFGDNEGNMSADDVIPVLRNMTSGFEMESRKYIPHAIVNELYWNGALDNGGGGSTTPNPFYDQLDNVYYYPAMFTNLTGYFGPEFPFNNALFLEIYDCTDGYVYDEDSYDYTFVAIDVDNDCSWDENDRAFYVDTNRNAVMWEGNSPAEIGEFFGDAFLTDQSSYRNLHRYNQHVHYYMLIPLDELMKESQIPLGEGDIFGLHIDTGNQDEWYSSDGGEPFVGYGYSCIWENWYEATDEQYIDEVYGLQQLIYVGNPYGPYEMFMGGFDGPPVCTIVDENLPYWGEGQIGNGTVNQTYNNKGISVTKEYSDEAGPWVLHYWVNVTNTGLDEISDFWINETWPTGTEFVSAMGEEGELFPEIDGESFHITTSDITFGSLYYGETFECEFYVYGLLGNGTCFTNRVIVDDGYGNHANDSDMVCWEISVEKTGPRVIEEGTTQTWWNISVCNTGDIPVNISVHELEYNNQTLNDYNTSGTGTLVMNGIWYWKDIVLYPGECWWVNITFDLDEGMANGTRLYNNITVNETDGQRGAPGEEGGDEFTVDEEGNDGDGTLYGAATFALMISYDTVIMQIPMMIYLVIVFLIILCLVLAAKLIMDKFNVNKQQ